MLVQIREDPRQPRSFRLGAAGVTVGVIRQREAAVGAAQFVGRIVRREARAQSDERDQGQTLPIAQSPARPGGGWRGPVRCWPPRCPGPWPRGRRRLPFRP